MAAAVTPGGPAEPGRIDVIRAFFERLDDQSPFSQRSADAQGKRGFSTASLWRRDNHARQRNRSGQVIIRRKNQGRLDLHLGDADGPFVTGRFAGQAANTLVRIAADHGVFLAIFFNDAEE